MSETVVATVKTFYEKNGNKPFKIVTMGDDQFSTFKEDVFKDYTPKEGDEVRLTVFENKKGYMTIDGIEPVNTAPDAKRSVDNQPQKNGMSKNERIKNQWALKVAAEMGAGPEEFQSAGDVPGIDDRVEALFNRADAILDEAEERWGL